MPDLENVYYTALLMYSIYAVFALVFGIFVSNKEEKLQREISGTKFRVCQEEEEEEHSVC